MRATKKNKQKKHSWKNNFLSHEIYLFFYPPKIQCARWEEKNACFFGNARAKSNARAHLRKKQSSVDSVKQKTRKAV